MSAIGNKLRLANPLSLIGFTRQFLSDNFETLNLEAYRFKVIIALANATSISKFSVAGVEYALSKVHSLATASGREEFLKDFLDKLGHDAELRILPEGVGIEVEGNNVVITTGHSHVVFDWIQSSANRFAITDGKIAGKNLDRGLAAFVADRGRVADNVVTTVSGPYVEAAPIIDGAVGGYVALDKADDDTREFTSAIPAAAGDHVIGVRIRASVRNEDTGATEIQEFDRVLTVTKAA
jgi:hypothetical protein